MNTERDGLRHQMAVEEPTETEIAKITGHLATTGEAGAGIEVEQQVEMRVGKEIDHHIMEGHQAEK